MKRKKILHFLWFLPLGFLFLYFAKRLQQPLIPWKPNFSSLPNKAQVYQVSNEPYIATISDFITDEEAEHIKKVASPILKRSFVMDGNNFEAISPDRTSSSAFLNLTESDIIPKIQKRAADLLNVDVKNVEGLQAVYYRDGQKYDPHFDFFDRNIDSGKNALNLTGQRIATLLVYLNDVQGDVGGETFFPKVRDGIKIKPKKNLAVFWYNVLPDGREDERTLHGGLPIYEGEKWAMNIWICDPRLNK